MRAFLLAGGRGERLRPFTLTRPKCLVPINGTPLLGIWLDRCAREGIDDVLVNVSHHAGPVREFLSSRAAAPRVEMVVEDVPRGSAGTVAGNRRFIDGEESFWVFYADNLTNTSLDPLRSLHERHGDALTMGVFHAPNPSAAGIVAMQPNGRIIAFEEKPRHPRGDLASAGIFLARAALLEAIPKAAGRTVDFGFDVLPRLTGRMHGCVLDGFFMDVGTPQSLARASEAWAALPQGGAR